MTDNKQPEHQSIQLPADDNRLEQPRQMDFFVSHHGQDSDTLESALDWIARERAQSINEWASFLDECDPQLMQSTDELQTMLRVIIWDQTQFTGKLKAVLNTYVREQHPDRPVFRKYCEDILPTFNLLPDNDIQHYLRKANIANDADEAIASDWSNVFGDLYFAFHKENQRDTQQDR